MSTGIPRWARNLRIQMGLCTEAERVFAPIAAEAGKNAEKLEGYLKEAASQAIARPGYTVTFESHGHRFTMHAEPVKRDA